ncbi:tyrosine-type recombinase/integrase [Patescibacteria group bacterium]|nr:tyrosine-type recombinase/integrase [Patescibacteria group bacterium]
MLNELQKLITDFLEHLEIEKGCSQLTIRNYHFYLKRFLEFTEINSPDKITYDQVRKFRLWLSRLQNPRGGGLSPATQNYHLIALRVFLKYLSKRDIKALSPEKIELAKVGERQIYFLEGDDLEKLLDAPLQVKQGDIIKSRDKAILELFFSTGLRVSELTNLSREDINLKKNEFSVLGKGKRYRVVFLSQQAKYWLKKYLTMRSDMEPALFIRYDRAAKNSNQSTRGPMAGLSPRSIQRLVKKYVKVAGLHKKITVHSLRHSYATDLLTGGADIRAVQELLGHKNITTTQIYTHITDQHLREIYQAFHGRQRKT